MDIRTDHGPSWVKLTPEQSEINWDLLEPMIETGLRRTDGELLPEDVRMMLSNGLMQAFVVYEGKAIHALCVTQVLAELHFRVCRVVILTGANMDDWSHFEYAVENWAKAMNCDYIDAFTRPGMVRKALPLGYYPKYQLIRKYVTKEIH